MSTNLGASQTKDLDFDIEASNKNLSYYSTTSYEQAIYYTLNKNNQNLEKLLRLGVDVNTKNNFDKTPLMTAAHLNNYFAVKKLLEAGARVNDETVPDRKNRRSGIRHVKRTALMYAAENASLKMIKLLIETGADKKAQDSQGRSAFEYLEFSF